MADPAGKFLYVSDSENDSVHVYAIGSNGGLTEISSSPYTIGSIPPCDDTQVGLAMDPAGKYLYATDQVNDDIVGFTINGTTGALTSMGAPVPTSTAPAQVTVDASGQYVYVADFGDLVNSVSAYTIASGTGALTPVTGSPFSSELNGQGDGPLGLATASTFLYVTEQNAVGNHSVAAMTILGSGSPPGSLTAMSGSPYAAGNAATGVAIALGKYLYVADNNDKTISGFTIGGGSGALTSMGSAFASSAAPWYLAVDTSGKFLYATNPGSGDDNITGFSINSSTGALTQFSGTPAAAGTKPYALTVVNVPQPQ